MIRVPLQLVGAVENQRFMRRLCILSICFVHVVTLSRLHAQNGELTETTIDEELPHCISKFFEGDLEMASDCLREIIQVNGPTLNRLNWLSRVQFETDLEVRTIMSPGRRAVFMKGI